MSVQEKYGTRRINRTPSKKTETIVYYSEDRSELESWVEERRADGSLADLGKIVRTDYSKSGPFWLCEITGETEYDENGIRFVRPPDGPQNHSLRTVCLSASLSQLIHYRVCWDHWLWKRVTQANDSDAPPPPSGYDTRTSDGAFMVGETRYAWTETANAPTENPGEGYRWVQVADCPTKPGVTHVERYTYQITEYGEYDHESEAVWAVRENLNTPSSQPLLGSFGIQGGSWKLDDARLEPNGRKWRATLVWTWNIHGWDTDIYPPHLRSV